MKTTQNVLDEINVKEAMSPIVLTVTPIEKLEAVAKRFQENGTNAAAVVDETGKCLGILTSSDLVRFQSELPEMDSHIDGGMSFETQPRQSDGSLEMVEHPFDEVQRHMTRCLQTIDQTSSLRQASKIMREQRIHHLVVLDESERPAGILSSLDILTKLDG